MIALQAHGFHAQVDPDGALIAALSWRGRPIFVTGTMRPEGAPTRFGCWPLVPFCNRAFGGRLHTHVGPIALPRNDAAGTIHGHGWEAPWQVAFRGDDRLTLAQETDWGPYRYRASMTLQFDPQAATVLIDTQNLGDRPLPFGIGLHPWFARDDATTIAAAARGALALGEAYRPTGHLVAPDVPLDGTAPLPLGREIAVNLVGWSGEARFRLPGLDLHLTASDSLRHPLLWSPAGASFVCFEPQSHGLGAASEAALDSVAPLKLLRPGETLAGWMRLAPAIA